MTHGFPWVTVLALASLNSVSSYYRRPREDWRAAANYVLSNSTPGDAVALQTAVQ